ncbi:magnesium-translocating P-type ATPase, partial [Candidatus Roizmanbacteria bacterium]|nr:magnesium-translocating P-type ATPase [Candidatus Roizmanbacteria bacterium]
GKIAESVVSIRPITDFQKGLMNFGNLIIKVVVFMTIAIFITNALLGHRVIDSLLFSLAIAVGLTPELLPVIVTISLSHGAGKLAKKHAVAKQLISIENLGNMDILCTDKTGTLTEGKIDVIDYLGHDGNRSEDILKLSLLCNSALIHHKVVGNAIDVALWEYALKNKVDINKKVRKRSEASFDYNRKAMYCIVENEKELLLIVKGAPDSILAFCDKSIDKDTLHHKFISLNKRGLRVIVLATRRISGKNSYSWDDVKDLTFDGYVTFQDVPKQTAKEALFQLSNLGVQTKIITGDNEVITAYVCNEVGIDTKHVLLGSNMENLSDRELSQKVDETNIFARVNPQQKLRIIQALQKNKHDVGYMGDGINDIPALHSADVGISVNSAVDVAKDAATIVLLRKSLDVIADGIIEGRKTFNNTIKYILMATSSNFGNMFSAAGGSFFLPFLPMTPAQILLTNGLYDISQTGIPSDNVDPESLLKPRHWNIDFIKKYMLFFGPLSSIFDFITFGILLFVFHARGALFQTGWFIESIATQILVVFVIRTSRTPFFLSKPSVQLLATCLILTAVGLFLPFTTVAKALGFVSPPPEYFLILILIIVTYLILIEIIKNLFLKRFSL